MFSRFPTACNCETKYTGTPNFACGDRRAQSSRSEPGRTSQPHCVQPDLSCESMYSRCWSDSMSDCGRLPVFDMVNYFLSELSESRQTRRSHLHHFYSNTHTILLQPLISIEALVRCVLAVFFLNDLPVHRVVRQVAQCSLITNLSIRIC